MYTYFSSNCAGLSSFGTDCVARDIVVQRVHRESGGSFPGAQGFAYWGSDDLDGISKFHREYPNCNGSDDPQTNCRSRTLYGDGSFTIDDGSWTLNGWPRIYKASTDTSKGHSGGPAYFTDAGNKYIFAVDSAEDCSGSSCTGSRPNYFRAIDEDWFDEMVGFMGL